jgi:ribonuclease HI
MMSPSTPHYLLFSESSYPSSNRANLPDQDGGWRFVLEAVDGSATMEASDREQGVSISRLDLLAVVRGLEALPQPSRVTLVTTSRYVSRGLRFGLAEWRENGWQWEDFGRMSPINNADLWQRVDRAMRIHTVQCRTIRVDPAHSSHANHCHRRGLASDERTARPAGSDNSVMEASRGMPQARGHSK